MHMHKSDVTIMALLLHTTEYSTIPLMTHTNEVYVNLIPPSSRFPLTLYSVFPLGSDEYFSQINSYDYISYSLSTFNISDQEAAPQYCQTPATGMKI